MTHASPSGHETSAVGHGSSTVVPGQTYFAPAEWEALRAEDRQGARNIVCLMTGVFIAGLIGYLGIAIWVA
jgi:hypothetical protein